MRIIDAINQIMLLSDGVWILRKQKKKKKLPIKHIENHKSRRHRSFFWFRVLQKKLLSSFENVYDENTKDQPFDYITNEHCLFFFFLMKF